MSGIRTVGNPENLTNRQHVFPYASIKRFTNSGGRVQVVLCPTQRQFGVKPDDDIFCARCAWDYRSESGYMLDIENSFQAIARGVIENRIARIAAEQATRVTDFWSLWKLRSELRDEPELDRVLAGVHGEPLTNEERDRLERSGAMFALSSRDHLPGRFVAGIKIQMDLHKLSVQHRARRWGIVRASSGEFLVPDGPGNLMAVPLTPQISLYAEQDDCIIAESEVEKANLTTRCIAKEYYFARDLTACPGA